MHPKLKSPRAAEAKAAEAKLAALESELATAEDELDTANAEYLRLSNPNSVTPIPGGHEAMLRFSAAEARASALHGEIKQARRDLDRLRAVADASIALATAEETIARMRDEQLTVSMALEGKRIALEGLKTDLGTLQAQIVATPGVEAAALAAKAMGKPVPTATVKAEARSALQARADAMSEALAIVAAEIQADEATLVAINQRISNTQEEANTAAMNTAQAEADDALARLVPILCRAREATRRVHGYAAWRTPDLDSLMHVHDRQAENA